jgi:hypothetical protein
VPPLLNPYFAAANAVSAMAFHEKAARVRTAFFAVITATGAERLLFIAGCQD